MLFLKDEICNSVPFLLSSNIGQWIHLAIVTSYSLKRASASIYIDRSEVVTIPKKGAVSFSGFLEQGAVPIVYLGMTYLHYRINIINSLHMSMYAVFTFL